MSDTSWIRVYGGKSVYVANSSISGSIYTEGGYRAGNVYFTRNGSYLELASGGNEMVVSGSTTMYINYRTSALSKEIPTMWYWNAGTSSTWASHTAAHYYEASDIRLKTNFEELKITSTELSSIPLFNFNWISDLSSNNTGTSA